MATDPQLPHILSTAAGRADQVAAQLASTATAVNLSATRAMLGWAGPRSRIWGPAALGVSRELITEARMTGQVADALRRAAKSASERLYYERLAAEAAQRRAAAAAAAARTTR